MEDACLNTGYMQGGRGTDSGVVSFRMAEIAARHPEGEREDGIKMQRQSSSR